MAGAKKISRNWSELLALSNSEGVDFLAVGDYALAAHGHERYTKVLDPRLAPTEENARKVAEVLTNFGYPELAPAVQEWTQDKAMVQMGRDPYRVDLLSFASGLDFAEARKTGVMGELGKISALSWQGCARKQQTGEWTSSGSCRRASHCAQTCRGNQGRAFEGAGRRIVMNNGLELAC